MAETKRKSVPEQKSFMNECMKRCRWFPLLPLVLGVGALALGYYLDAEITRVLWMIAAGTIVLMGVLGLAMMVPMSKKYTAGFSCCCGPQSSSETFDNFCCAPQEKE